jgi:nickel transport protein
MRRALIRIVALLAVLALSPAAWGHGTMGSIGEADGLRVYARYDDGAPMDYADVEITTPADGTVFQTGRTDRNGVFMFVPDQPGKWRIVIRDGMGHQLTLGHRIESLAPAEKTDCPAQPTRTEAVSRRDGLIAGIGGIIGVFGLLFGWKARRRYRH